jgi:hypothetical protein
MGRLGPVNSLAFGRSPFQPPELDDNGDFILGPHAHDAENKDFYEQQFDARGHPKNDASDSTIRAMQNAQNAVLETVGVVVRREEASKSAWQRLSKKRKMEDIVYENNYGNVLRELGPFLMQSSMWWAISVRRRMQTFRSYLGPSVQNILRSEYRSIGLLSMLTDGLLPAITSYVINILLAGMHNRKLQISIEMTIRGTEYSWEPFTSFTSGLIIPLIVFPAKAYAVLQSLHLIPSTFHLSPWSWVPFTSASPIQLPLLSKEWSIGTGLNFASSICCNAFVISTISDMTKSYIHNAMYRIILLTLVPRPDHPDELTTQAAKIDRSDGETLLLPGIGPENLAERLSRARSSDFWTELKRELTLLLTLIRSLRNIGTTASFLTGETRPTPHENSITSQTLRQFWARSAALQRQMVRENLEHLRENEAERIFVQEQAHIWALAEFNLSSRINPDDRSFLLEAYQIFDSDSTATPEPVNLNDEPATGTEDLEGPPLLFDRFTSDNTHDREEREGEGRILASLGFNDPNDATDLENASRPLTYPSPNSNRSPIETPTDLAHDHVVEATSSLAPSDTSVDRRPSRFQTDSPFPRPNIPVPDQSLTPPPQAPDSPLDRNATPPAISRNRAHSPFGSGSPVSSRSRASTSNSPRSPSPHPSITSRSSSSHASSGPGPRRIESTPPTPLLRRAAHLRSPSSSDDGSAHNILPVAVTRHRVTMLSVFPAGMLAEVAAGLITSMVTLPLDSLYVRALVNGFLDRPNTSRPGAGVAALGLRGDVYGIGDWFGGSEKGWEGRVRYAGLMALMFGVQGCMSSISWTLATKLAIALGRQLGWEES